VRTDTDPGLTDASKFALRVGAWSLGLFGLLRLSWIEAHAVLPLTRAQGGLAVGLFGEPTSPIEVTLACSGTDALALCLGTILAYPVTWNARLAGAAFGTAIILSLNTVRIGTLGLAAASASWFNTLHIYIWPAVLMLAIAAYVFTWMHFADRTPSPLTTKRPAAPQPSRRFIVLTVALLVVFIAASPLYLGSAGVLALAGFIASAAAAILAIGGGNATAAANLLLTPGAVVVVTQECISTPLIPIYLAAICTYSSNWRWLSLGVLATLPLFVALGIVRLLLLALPFMAASSMFLVHAFYQLLLGAVVVCLAAMWRHGGRPALRHASLGVLAGTVVVLVLGPVFTRVIPYPAAGPLDDPQGAIAFLPAFQIGLYLALWVAAFVAVGWTRFVAGLAVLGLTQTAALLVLQALASSGIAAHVRDIRGWAVAGPVLVFAAVVNVARTRR
jgi:exosortase/archaeosortase family protein